MNRDEEIVMLRQRQVQSIQNEKPGKIAGNFISSALMLAGIGLIYGPYYWVEIAFGSL